MGREVVVYIIVDFVFFFKECVGIYFLMRYFIEILGKVFIFFLGDRLGIFFSGVLRLYFNLGFKGEERFIYSFFYNKLFVLFFSC